MVCTILIVYFIIARRRRKFFSFLSSNTFRKRCFYEYFSPWRKIFLHFGMLSDFSHNGEKNFSPFLRMEKKHWLIYNIRIIDFISILYYIYIYILYMALGRLGPKSVTLEKTWIEASRKLPLNLGMIWVSLDVIWALCWVP